MNGPGRWAGLPVLAVLLACTVVGVQLANGGGAYEPLRPADPCVERQVTSQVDGIEGLTERLVLLGLDEAGCTLGVTREELALRFAQSGDRTDAEIEAVRDGLKSAVRRMNEDGTLPPASALVDEALDSVDLNRVVEAAIRVLPDRVIDSALKTDDVLTRSVDELDLPDLLEESTDQAELEQEIGVAVEQAVKDSLADRLRNLL